MDTYIFLDIDGVLNKESDWVKPYTLNPACIDAFAKYAKKLSNPKIILSSSWRFGMDPRGDLPHIAELKRLLALHGLTIAGRTKRSADGDRTKEIMHYIRMHDVSNYIVIDDTEEEFKTPIQNLMLINCKTGFVQRR